MSLCRIWSNEKKWKFPLFQRFAYSIVWANLFSWSLLVNTVIYFWKLFSWSNAPIQCYSPKLAKLATEQTKQSLYHEMNISIMRWISPNTSVTPPNWHHMESKLTNSFLFGLLLVCVGLIGVIQIFHIIIHISFSLYKFLYVASASTCFEHVDDATFAPATFAPATIAPGFTMSKVWR